MERINVYEYKNILHEVYSLSFERKSAPNSVGKIGDFNLDEYRMKRKHSELLQYLDSLTLKEIQIIEAVMYVGRDLYQFNHPTTQDNSNPSVEELSSTLSTNGINDLVETMMDELKINTKFDSKSIDINTIYSKTMLNKYLEAVFERFYL